MTTQSSTLAPILQGMIAASVFGTGLGVVGAHVVDAFDTALSNAQKVMLNNVNGPRLLSFLETPHPVFFSRLSPIEVLVGAHNVKQGMPSLDALSILRRVSVAGRQQMIQALLPAFEQANPAA